MLIIPVNGKSLSNIVVLMKIEVNLLICNKVLNVITKCITGWNTPELILTSKSLFLQ